MSTELIISEIEKFLTREEPEILCIRGKWGVGKTYTWNDLLSAARKNKKIALPNYSYVSLFGLNSLAALKFAIFENVVSLGGDHPLAADINSLQDFIDAAPSQWRKVLALAKKLPIVNRLTGEEATSAISFLTIRDMIICIDDLERKGASLTVSDVLGLASELRERRRCKVVFLFNEEELGEERASFESYLEKVVDISLLFEPTVAESAAIAKNHPQPALERTIDLCQSLGIRNIRVIKKIDRHICDAYSIVHNMKAGVFEQISASIALFGWAYYQSNEAPSLEHIKNYNAFSTKQDSTPEEITWNAQLDAYGFIATDDLDLELLKGIERGFFDAPKIIEHAEILEKKLIAEEADGSFTEAWSLYHDSFDDNETEVVRAIYETFLKNIPYISPLNLNGTVTLLKELGHPGKAKHVIAEYVEKRSDERAFFDLDEYSFAEEISDPDVQKAFRKRFQGIEETRDFKPMILGLKHGWNDKTIATLSALDADTYRDLFKSARSQELRNMISGCLQFDTITNASPPMKKISASAREALATIGAESQINARRVRKYGIQPKKRAPRKSKEPAAAASSAE